jgi:glyoxylase-like metal-dependent hydrolase (beta-lactamase superfamily II)
MRGQQGDDLCAVSSRQFRCSQQELLGLLAQRPAAELNIYYIDTEGGQSTLFVSPAGESLLVDTGNAGERDLGRIVETVKGAGVKQIDHMWTTHYHGDHVGSLLASRQAGSDHALL